MFSAQHSFPMRITLGRMLIWSYTAYSQKIDLSGTIISMYGNPMPGLVVTLGNARVADTTFSGSGAVVKLHELHDAA